MRREVILALCTVLMFSVSSFALQLDPVPDGFNIILVAHNHSNIPLAEFMDKLPIPPQAKEKVDEFLKETSFHPLKDISRIQLMLKKTEAGKKRPESAVAVFTGNFPKEKITAYLTSKKLPLQQSKLEEFELWKGERPGGLCFLSDAKVIAGDDAGLKAYVDAHKGKNLSDDFALIGNSIDDKAYVTLLVGNTDYLKAEMELRRKRMKEKSERKRPLNNFLHGYIVGDVKPILFQAHLLDSCAEFQARYQRENKDYSVKGRIDFDDPKLALNNMVPEIFNEIARLAPHGKAKDDPSCEDDEEE